MAVDGYILPVTGRHIVELVSNAEMRISLGDTNPPFPSFAVSLAMCEGMSVVGRPEVAHHHELICGWSLVGGKVHDLAEN